MNAVYVLKPGMLTTVQDIGRWGYQSRGVPVAGPMDRCSHRLANVLVGNDDSAAGLEITLVGPELEFGDERLVAVAGGEFALTLDGRPAPHLAPFLVSSGSQLRFGQRRKGGRAYLAVSGGIAGTPVFGSRATHVPSGMGGINGRALKNGDLVPLNDAPSARRTRRAADAIVPLPEGRATIRVLPGPQADYFAAGAVDALQSAPYTITLQSDRMAFRLEGPRLTHSRGADIISDATPLGVLQVPASGQPILLMADRQTTGGYPKIATVITADISLAGQLGPGDTIELAVCTPRDALAALIAQEQAFLRLTVD